MSSGDSRDDELIGELRRALGVQPGTSDVEEPRSLQVVDSSDPTGRPSPATSDARLSINPVALKVADAILGPGRRPADGSLVDMDQGRCLGAGVGVLVDGTGLQVPSSGLILGRQPGRGGAVVTDRQVSRRHARLEWMGSILGVTDLDSANGTMVERNDTTLQVSSNPVRLVAGDRIVTGGGVLLAEVVPQ